MKDTLSVDNPGDWDSPVSSKLIKEWASAVKEGILQDSLWFPHATLCTCAVKKPRLVGFWDGSSQAFSAVFLCRYYGIKDQREHARCSS